MSRIGRMPIAVPAGVTVDIAENNHVTVKGPKGTLERTLPSEMDIKLEGAEVMERYGIPKTTLYKWISKYRNLNNI
jgi:ribosomal protein L6P/L9E